jgi:hypothetical protein
MKTSLNKLTAARAKLPSRLVLVGVGILALGAGSGCIVVQDSPRSASYPEPLPPPPVQEEVAVEQPVYAPQPPEVVNVYEQELSPYGHWVYTRYGRCWVYDNRPPGWQPYTVGHWISTEDGWCWVSEDREASWGPTCYHYGRWYEDGSYGWVWVPGRVWGPSWVAWREGEGHCAWAPLPPECGDGQRVDVVVVERYVPQRHYVSCDERYIAEPHMYQHVERNNVTIINRTTNITNITYVNNRVVNRGIPVEHVRERSGRNIETASVTRVDNASDARRLAAEGRPVQYAPPVVERYAKAHPTAAPRALAPRPVQPKPANGWPSQESPAARQGMPNHGVAQPPAKVRPDIERPAPKPRPVPEAQAEPGPRPPVAPKAERPPRNYPPQESPAARQGIPNEGGPPPAVKPQPRPRPAPQPQVKGEPRPEPGQEPQPNQNPSAHPVPKQKPKPGPKPQDPSQ